MHPILTRAFSDSLLALGATRRRIIVAVVGTAATALLTRFFRGREKFWDHIKGVFIAFIGSGILLWFIVFLWLLATMPLKMLKEDNVNIGQLIQQKQQLTVKINALQAENEKLRHPPLEVRHWKDMTFQVESAPPPAANERLVFVYSLYDTVSTPVHLKLICTDVSGITNISMTVGKQEVANPTWTLPSSNAIEVAFTGPAINPVANLTIDLYGATPNLKVLQVERAIN